MKLGYRSILDLCTLTKNQLVVINCGLCLFGYQYSQAWGQSTLPSFTRNCGYKEYLVHTCKNALEFHTRHHHLYP